MIRRLVLACLAVSPLVAALSYAASAPAPIRAKLEASEPRVEASDYFMWNLQFRLTNQSERGVYCDSLVCEIEDQDPGVTHGPPAETNAPRHSRVVVTAVSRLLQSLSAGDSTDFQIQIGATCEHARVACRLFLHDVDRNTAAFDAAFETDPAPIAVAHPSQMLKTHSGKVEYVGFAAPPESLGTGAVLLIHDESHHARSLIPLAAWLAGRGYSVGIVSMPGYGLSDGTADPASPSTLEAVDAAFEALEHTPRVNGSLVAVWGAGSGATAAVLFAARHPEARAIIAQSGSYDPAKVGRIKASVLVMHGEKDTRNPAAQAHAFADALKARGVDVETRFVPAGDHALKAFEVRRVALDFLYRHLAP